MFTLGKTSTSQGSVWNEVLDETIFIISNILCQLKDDLDKRLIN